MLKPLAVGAIASIVALLALGCGGATKTTSSAASNASLPETKAIPTVASTTSSATTPSGDGTVVITKLVKLGRILAAGPKKLTVYLFEGDKGTTSTCSGVCAQTWRPVTTSSAPAVAEMAIPGDLGTITRPDGTKQVTYFHHPLYYYTKDRKSGDAHGQGVKSFGSRWYALRPIGVKFEKTKAWD